MDRSRRARVWPLLPLALAAALGAVLVAAALQWRNPGLVGRWPGPQLVFAGLDLVALTGAVALARRRAALAILAALLPVTAAGVAALATYRASALRAAVLAVPPSDLHEAAGHVIAGFYTSDEARSLAGLGVAGLFLSPRNVRGRSAGDIAAEIAAWQALRREARLPPLWIASDQEGGRVAALSPPLPRPPPLAAVADDADAIAAEAGRVAGDLARLGVDVNFAPVVDVTRGRLDPRDRNSRIALRSLSPDPAVVARDADRYCRVLAAHGVRCTIKHFPGLGDVTVDTHVAAAHRPAIDARDLAPFRDLTAAGGPRPWVMLSHLVVDGLDPYHPASASPALIALLRGMLGYDGVLVTDDAAMAPYRAHLAANAVATIRGGGDLVLASWDPDVAFAVIAALAAAESAAKTVGKTAGENADIAAALRSSDERLAREAARSARRQASREAGTSADATHARD